jgi:predicted nuclease of predicted toxin-antitoxin system
VKFLVDECAGPALALWLGRAGHDVFSVYDEAPGLPDDEVIQKAHDEGRVLVTSDKGFGERVYRDGRPHAGVVLLRLNDERAAAKIAAVQRVLDWYVDRIEGRFVVVTESIVRVGRKQAAPGM